LYYFYISNFIAKIKILDIHKYPGNNPDI
jgi:hypothetical protein